MTIVKVGGVSAILLGVVQLAGIVMHGSIPVDPGEGLAFVRDHPVWPLTHVLLIASYLVIVSFYVGLRASFVETHSLLDIAANLTLVGAILGAVHFTIHLSLYPVLASQHSALAGTAAAGGVLDFYVAAHQYAHALNRASLFILMLVALVFSISMLREASFKRWIAILGIASSVVTAVTVAIAELTLPRQVTDIVFAIVLLPTIVWIVSVGVSMLKIKAGRPAVATG